jgi:hypothetical protein
MKFNGCKLTSSPQSGIEHANPDIGPHLAVALFENRLHDCEI